jgi:glutaredoxin
MKFVLILMICAGLFIYRHPDVLHNDNSYQASAQNNQKDMVYMYGASYCGTCKAVAHDMTAAGVPFVEYYVDQDTARKSELDNRMRQANAAGGRIGLPVLFIKNTMLMGRQPVSTIQAALQ